MVQTLTLSEVTLECGRTLYEAPVAYRTWGRLNRAGDNAIVVCHALTGNTNADEWWGGLFGPGRALDPERYFIICPNVIGSPYGTVSPVTTDPATGRPYGADFPEVTVRDTVRIHRRLADHLGVRKVALVIGGSMGGMQVLEWAFFGDYVGRLAPIAVGGRHSAWCIGWSEAQRQAIYADARWNGGRYDPEDPPDAGLSAARMMAMVSYRSHASFESRFGRDRMSSNGCGAVFSVESYLRYQGKKLVGRFDANCYVRLTKLMDSHDISRARGDYYNVLRTIRQPALVVGIQSDVLYPLVEQEELAANIPGATLAVLDVPHGHDSFLIEQNTLNQLVKQWMDSSIEKRTAPRAGAYTGSAPSKS